MTEPRPWHPTDDVVARHRAKHPADVIDCPTCAACDLAEHLDQFAAQLVGRLDALRTRTDTDTALAEAQRRADAAETALSRVRASLEASGGVYGPEPVRQALIELDGWGAFGRNGESP
ncbi:hypothetical protein LO762_16530 [Actinocorallia sp. API 0066]|uniref:hypothetical protein n=1 Tax=Actinocorallia sp. API 0066 TaxID=2896846 RepID=UPI001E3969EB|nr:hypothetical protein [Actinocorallia sp. API 0066]MCD0450785.1 hypothetical protein [Actinocorallia sp. API 0066]